LKVLFSYGKLFHMNELEKFRTRWNRWLGQKRRKDKPYWTTLLDSNWLGWATNVLDKNDKSLIMVYEDRDTIRYYFKKAIEHADMRDLMKLDNLYCTDKLSNR
jgi:hypothetical protein